MHVLNLRNAEAWKYLQVVKVHIFQYTGEFNFDNRQVHKRFFSENLRFPNWEQILRAQCGSFE